MPERRSSAPLRSTDSVTTMATDRHTIEKSRTSEGEMKSIMNILQDCQQGSQADYLQLLQAIANPCLDPSTLIVWIKELQKCTSSLGQEFEPLVRALLRINWSTKGPKLMKHYRRLVTHLISAHSVYLAAVLTMLAKNLLPSDPPPDTRHFAVNVLAKDQVHYGVHFSKPAREDEDQFNAVPHKLGLSGVPIIEGTAAVLQCQAHATHLIGDHHVWYGEVLDAKLDLATKGQHPLLYFARSIGDEAFMKAFEDTTLLFDDWSHEAHLRMAWNYIRRNGKEDALPLIRNGIKKYNSQHKDKVQRGYHETMTMFFSHVVAEAIKQCENVDITFEEFISQHSHLTDPSLITNYYSKELISSPAARFRFEPPDLQDLPGLER